MYMEAGVFVSYINKFLTRHLAIWAHSAFRVLAICRIMVFIRKLPRWNVGGWVIAITHHAYLLGIGYGIDPMHTPLENKISGHHLL